MATKELEDAKLSEDSRYGLFTDALDQSIQKIVHNILSHKAMAECFPQLKKKKPETLTQLHTILINTVQKKLREELDGVSADFDLKNKLDLIDQLDTEQRELTKGETVWRPTGIPERDLLAYDVPALQKHKEELQKLVKEARAKNEEEKRRILETVEQMRAAEKHIEDLLAKNEETIEILSNIPSV